MREWYKYFLNQKPDKQIVFDGAAIYVGSRYEHYYKFLKKIGRAHV